jgi:uncharacterized protein YneR
MKLTIDNKAAKWYEEELNLSQGDFVRFFVRYGGCGTVQTGFSLGVVKDTPMELGKKAEVGGITFFIEEKDMWYFDQHSLHISYNEKFSEPEFNYTKK